MRQHVGYHHQPAHVVGDEPPISRTYQYRKVMKPMLERKRRARINRCLDELKELMVCALQAEGENVSKLEKADILELTVRHLHKLKADAVAENDRFRAGFTHCAAEVSSFLASGRVEGELAPESGVKLLQHLGGCIRKMETSSVDPVQKVEHHNPYSTPPSSPQLPPTVITESAPVWRPW